jgi:hypothetical protein
MQPKCWSLVIVDIISHQGINSLNYLARESLTLLLYHSLKIYYHSSLLLLITYLFVDVHSCK